MARPSRYSPEARERAIRMVREHGAGHPSQWAAMASIASRLGCTAETLQPWVRQAERDTGQRAGLTTDERQRLKELERRGDAYENALTETVIGLFKTEVIRRRAPWRTLEAVEFATLECVDWFNTRRLLEPIGYIPPAEYEARYDQQAAVA